MFKLILLIFLTIFFTRQNFALEIPDQDLSKIINFRQYSATYSSAGQPTLEQLTIVAEKDFQRVIYIAFSDNAKAISNEDKLVKELGMEYIHIPVSWDNPKPADFYAFADIMRRDPTKKTLLHCQLNYRATAFSYLYRVIYQGVEESIARAEMNTVWEPDEVWTNYIENMLKENNKF
jgi:protein tyrosine phosphatase (PTP) superfamily phosphohydrolase (DUF442 family)